MARIFTKMGCHTFFLNSYMISKQAIQTTYVFYIFFKNVQTLLLLNKMSLHLLQRPNRKIYISKQDRRAEHLMKKVTRDVQRMRQDSQKSRALSFRYVLIPICTQLLVCFSGKNRHTVLQLSFQVLLFRDCGELIFQEISYQHFVEL